MLIKHIKKPDTKPYLFKVGQIVRILGHISKDGQTPKYWDGAKVMVLKQKCSMLHKEHSYVVKHLDQNVMCEFKEYELDNRYSRKKYVKSQRPIKDRFELLDL